MPEWDQTRSLADNIFYNQLDVAAWLFGVDKDYDQNMYAYDLVVVLQAQ